jgi:hypothetical protein
MALVDGFETGTTAGFTATGFTAFGSCAGAVGDFDAGAALGNGFLAELSAF